MVAEYGFPKTSRLLTPKDYQAVFDQAHLKVSTPELLFLARPNGLPHARLGLVIARKNVRLAVQRNRVKRILRETFRQHQPPMPGLDVVVLARKGLDKLDNRQLHETCEQLWRQLQRRAEKHRRQQGDS